MGAPRKPGVRHREHCADGDSAGGVELEVKRMGLVPMGDSGTYFQWVPLVNLEFDTASTIAVGAVTLKTGQDFIVRPTRAAFRSISGEQAVYAAVLGDSNMLEHEHAAAE